MSSTRRTRTGRACAGCLVGLALAWPARAAVQESQGASASTSQSGKPGGSKEIDWWGRSADQKPADPPRFEPALVAHVEASLAGMDWNKDDAAKRFAGEMTQLGRAAIRPLIGCVRGEVEWQKEGLGASEQALQLGAMNAALDAFPAEDLLGELAAYAALEFADAEAATQTKVFAIETAARANSPHSIESILAWMHALTDLDFMRVRYRASMVDALSRALLQRPQGFALIGRTMDSFTPTGACVLVEGVAATNGSRGLEFLAGILGKEASVDQAALRAMEAVLRCSPLRLSPSALARVRTFLSSMDEEQRRTSATVVGRLRDVDSCQALVAQLSAPEGLVRASALWSLRQITGSDQGERSAAWADWLDEEERWWTQVGQTSVESLAHGDDAQILTAVAELMQHPLHRERIAVGLTPLLRSDNIDQACMACAALEHLSATSAMPVLADTLTSQNERLRAAARKALRTISGLDLGEDASAWRDALSR